MRNRNEEGEGGVLTSIERAASDADASISPEMTMSNAERGTGGDHSLDQLEAQSEKIRAGFADTVDEFRHRLSPDTIRSDVRNHISQTRHDMLAKLERSVHENPLQTIAVGAGIAYPLVSLLRSMPAPILLMGAGVALSGRGNLLTGLLGNGTTPDAVATSREKAADLADKATSRMASAGSAASSAARDIADRASEAARDNLTAANDLAATTSERVSDAAASVVRTASHLAGSVGESATASYHDGIDAVAQATDRVAAVGGQGRETLIQTVNRHPLMAGVLTALAGAALASFLPSSRTESRLFGEASSRVKAQARSAAVEGKDAVLSAGERIYDATVHAAEGQGLSPASGGEAIHDIAGRAGAVVDTAFKAVLPQSSPDQPSDIKPSNTI